MTWDDLFKNPFDQEVLSKISLFRSAGGKGLQCRTHEFPKQHLLSWNPLTPSTDVSGASMKSTDMCQHCSKTRIQTCLQCCDRDKTQAWTSACCWPFNVCEPRWIGVKARQLFRVARCCSVCLAWAKRSRSAASGFHKRAYRIIQIYLEEFILFFFLVNGHIAKIQLVTLSLTGGLWLWALARWYRAFYCSSLLLWLT